MVKIPTKKRDAQSITYVGAIKGPIKAILKIQIPKNVAFPNPIFLVSNGTTGIKNNKPNAKQNNANPICESSNFSFSFT